MALFSMKLENLQQLYLKELRDLYDAEKQITVALPKLINAASNPELKSGLQEHLEVTNTQISRLESIFQSLNEKPTGETCKGMKGVSRKATKSYRQVAIRLPWTLASSALPSAWNTTRWQATARFAPMRSCWVSRSTQTYCSRRWTKK